MSENTTETRAVRLKFLREQLLYDIKNYAFVEGEVMDEEKFYARHTLMEVGEEGNIDRVSRILAVVHAAVIEMLYPYTKLDAEEEEVSDELWEPDEYMVELRVPATFSRTTVHLLSRLIHEFMVYSALHDWLTITNPEKAGHWLEKAEATRAEIEQVKNLRTGTLTRKCRPW